MGAGVWRAGGPRAHFQPKGSSEYTDRTPPQVSCGGLLQPGTASGPEVNSLFDFSSSFHVCKGGSNCGGSTVPSEEEGTFTTRSLDFHGEPRVNSLLTGDFFQISGHG